jgi:hypothetical protein
MVNICTPTIIYIIFSITQIIIDTFKGFYNTAFMKTIVMIMVSLLLNILCERGLSIISWIIVFIPFILMTVIVTMLLYIFGLDPKTGKLNYDTVNKSKEKECPKNITFDNNGNIVIFNPYYNPSKNPVYYNSPNIIIPNKKNAKPVPIIPSFYSSDPSYKQ